MRTSFRGQLKTETDTEIRSNKSINSLKIKMIKTNFQFVCSHMLIRSRMYSLQRKEHSLLVLFYTKQAKGQHIHSTRKKVSLFFTFDVLPGFISCPLSRTHSSLVHNFMERRKLHLPKVLTNRTLTISCYI